MARYWVGDEGDHSAPAADPASVHSRRPTGGGERERITDAVRRTLAGNVTVDDPADRAS